MEDPVTEIPNVIRLLIHSPPDVQRRAIERYFTPSAAFSHPFCRVGSFNGSRWVIVKIYQWYKIMSPRIEFHVHSVAFDETNLLLYVTMSQVFSVWIFPFHVSPVTLTTVISLTTGKSKVPSSTSMSDAVSSTPTNGHAPTLYYIARQDDLYPTTEWMKFLVPHLGHWIVMAIHFFATLACIIGVYAWWPFMWLDQKRIIPNIIPRRGNIGYDIGNKVSEIKHRHL